MAQAPWFRGPGGGFSSRYGSNGGGTLQPPEAVPQAGAWAGFWPNGLLAKRVAPQKPLLLISSSCCSSQRWFGGS